MTETWILVLAQTDTETPKGQNFCAGLRNKIQDIKVNEIQNLL